MSNVQQLKKSKLKAIAPQEAEPSKPKILIFGKAGVGKTWTSLDFPSVYYIDTEGGANRQHYTDKLVQSGGAYMGPEHGSLDFDTVIEQIQALATEKHPFKTVVVDSFTKLYQTYQAEMADKVGDDFGRDKKEANKPTRRLIGWLGKLDMNVILIAHEKALWGLDHNKQRTEIGVTFDAYEKLDYELDLCMNIIKAGPNRNAKVTKSRLLGFEENSIFPWSYKEFADRYGKDVIEKEGKQIILATEQQLKKINALKESVKLKDGEEALWLKKAKAEKWEDVEQEKAQMFIDHINNKYIKGDE